MLGWKKYPSETAEFEVVTLTRENVVEMVTFLIMEGKVVGGGLGEASLNVNGVDVPEGSRVFKRLSDGTIGVLPPADTDAEGEE